ncbi:hypothetical protein [Burkholderia pseudomultivorans]|uniref:hypothetical protein n=1 Tax=Burkholderia pseudomultivorans TaxID=1207504 RepID=UPI0009BEA978|nr:hypothetical protein [Burkholderia pseudomultivorans]
MPTRKWKWKQNILWAAAAFAITSSGAAMAGGTVIQGTIAPEEVLKQLRATPAVTIGGTAVRPVPSGAIRAASSEGAGNVVQSGRDNTFVIRDSDNLVGISTNDLIVVYPDTAAVNQAVAGQVKSVKIFPQIDTVIVHVASFDQLVSVQAALARKFPTAKFNLPVRYSETRPK